MAMEMKWVSVGNDRQLMDVPHLCASFTGGYEIINARKNMGICTSYLMMGKLVDFTRLTIGFMVDTCYSYSWMGEHPPFCS